MKMKVRQKKYLIYGIEVIIIFLRTAVRENISSWKKLSDTINELLHFPFAELKSRILMGATYWAAEFITWSA